LRSNGNKPVSDREVLVRCHSFQKSETPIPTCLDHNVSRRIHPDWRNSIMDLNIEEIPSSFIDRVLIRELKLPEAFKDRSPTKL
jgi:hypothetical protein